MDGTIPLEPISQMAVLRRFEPVVRFTRGERFFPIDVERYIQQCSLWVQRPGQAPQLLVPQGALTVEKLIQPRQEEFGAVYYLRFIEPPDILELAQYTLRQAVKSLRRIQGMEKGDAGFRAGVGRLARVGYGSRLVDALFSLSLLLRGRVPGDTAIAAALTYQRMQAQHEQYCYYGRMVRENGWVILQYWFFYPFNNWRSGFFGVNDHEGDWEMACIYCSESPAVDPNLSLEDRLVPRWVAYASHDFHGDDLRRRWDDPEVEKVIDYQGHAHPVMYVGAGSHAAYFRRGEYLSEIELPFLSPLVKLVDRLQGVWHKVLRLPEGLSSSPGFNVFRIPFVDYARGDGLSIGPGQDREWQPQILSEHTPWAVGYRGLWGLYVKDPIAGENAPAGPVYNRDRKIRRSWCDPLGWAGLDKVPPPEQTLAVIEAQQAHIRNDCTEIEQWIKEKSAELQGLGVEALALQHEPHLEAVYRDHMQRIATLSAELREQRQRLATEAARLEALERYRERLLQGDRGPMRAHIHHPQQPSSGYDQPLAIISELIAAISIGVLMIGLVLLLVFFRHYVLFGLAALVGLLIFIEAGFRRQLTHFINSLTLGLAFISALVLFFRFFWQIVIVAVLMAGVYLIWGNVREILGR